MRVVSIFVSHSVCPDMILYSTVKAIQVCSDRGTAVPPLMIVVTEVNVDAGIAELRLQVPFLGYFSLRARYAPGPKLHSWNDSGVQIVLKRSRISFLFKCIYSCYILSFISWGFKCRDPNESVWRRGTAKGRTESCRYILSFLQFGIHVEIQSAPKTCCNIKGKATKKEGNRLQKSN